MCKGTPTLSFPSRCPFKWWRSLHHSRPQHTDATSQETIRMGWNPTNTTGYTREGHGTGKRQGVLSFSFIYSRPTLFTGTATRQEGRKPPHRVNCLFWCRKEGISCPCHVENTRDVVRRGHPSCSLRPRPAGTPISGMSPSCLPAPLVVHPLSEPTRGPAVRPPRPSPPTLSRPLHIRKDRHTHSPHSCTLQISSHQTPTSMARWERNTSGSRWVCELRGILCISRKLLPIKIIFMLLHGVISYIQQIKFRRQR